LAVTVDFETVSILDGIVTRRLTIQPDSAVAPSLYAAVQFSLGYDTTNISISERSLLPGAAGVSPSLSPSTLSGLADTSELRVAAITSQGLTSSNTLLELVYSHDASLDPVFVLSGLMLDESMLIPGSIQFSAETAPVVDTPVVIDTATVSLPLGSSGPNFLYWFADDRVGVSSESVAAGGEIVESSILYLRMTPNTYLSAQTLIDSGVSELLFSQANGAYDLSLSFQDGSRSVLSFTSATGLLSGSVDTPASEIPEDPLEGEPISIVIEDGINTGTGITDTAGTEVDAADVLSLLPSAEQAFVAYRQRLGDAVAIEAVNRDGSYTGKIVGDGDARTVRQISNGSTELTVDLPTGSTLDLLGLASQTDKDGASQYLRTLIDAAVPASGSESTAWNSSLKQAVSKATSDLLGKSFKLDIVTPIRQGSGIDEMAIVFAGEGDALGAFNLANVNDLVTVSGYDSLVAVGPGRIAVSGSSASVYGDTFSQNIAGGQGSDFLSGGGGSDTLTGGAGADTFELGFAGTTVIADLAAEDVIAIDLFGVNSVDQLVARIQSVSVGQAGLLVQFDSFAVELVGYNDIGQISSGIVF